MTKQQILDELELLSPLGATILEYMNTNSLNVSDMAARMKQTTDDLITLILGKTVITPSLSILLYKATNIDCEFWLNQDKQYRKKLNTIAELIANNKPPKPQREYAIRNMNRLDLTTQETDELQIAAKYYKKNHNVFLKLQSITDDNIVLWIFQGMIANKQYLNPKELTDIAVDLLTPFAKNRKLVIKPVPHKHAKN